MKLIASVTLAKMCEDCALEHICMAMRDNQQMGIECPFASETVTVMIEESK